MARTALVARMSRREVPRAVQNVVRRELQKEKIEQRKEKATAAKSAKAKTKAKMQERKEKATAAKAAKAKKAKKKKKEA